MTFNKTMTAYPLPEEQSIDLDSLVEIEEISRYASPEKRILTMFRLYLFKHDHTW